MKAITMIVNQNTGEVIENQYGVFIPNSQKENYKKIKEQKERIDEKYKEYGKFTWLLYRMNVVLDLGIRPESLTKLIYLSTFINYENELMCKKNVRMNKEKMQEILGIKSRSIIYFYKEMIDNNLLIEKDNIIIINDEIFKRGTIKKINKEDISITRLYKKGIRHLYENAKLTEHKFLSYAFQIIPFVNTEYNIICKNPNEKDLEYIQPLSVQEIAELVGYAPHMWKRLATNFAKTSVNGHPFINIVFNDNGYKAFINPRVLYSGNQWNRIEVLGAFDKKKEILSNS